MGTIVERVAEFLSKFFSQEMVTLIVAALPISELRGALPLALGIFHFPVSKAFVLSFVGNILPIVPVLLFLNYISEYCMRYGWGNKFFNWWFKRTRKHSEIIEKYEAVGLAIFVGIPLPFTGAWSGCVAAYLLGIKFRYALPAIVIGVLLAGIVVTLTTLGLIKIF